MRFDLGGDALGVAMSIGGDGDSVMAGVNVGKRRSSSSRKRSSRTSDLATGRVRVADGGVCRGVEMSGEERQESVVGSEARVAVYMIY